MCDLCKTYGRKQLRGKTLEHALGDLGAARLGEAVDGEHLESLMDVWTGFVPGPESEANADAAAAWERSHREVVGGD